MLISLPLEVLILGKIKKNNAYDEKNLSGSHFFDSCIQQMVFLPFSKLGKHYEKNEDINYLP